MKTDGGTNTNSDILIEEKHALLKGTARKFISEPGIAQTGIKSFSISMPHTKSATKASASSRANTNECSERLRGQTSAA